MKQAPPVPAKGKAPVKPGKKAPAAPKPLWKQISERMEGPMPPSKGKC